MGRPFFVGCVSGCLKALAVLLLKERVVADKGAIVGADQFQRLFSLIQIELSFQVGFVCMPVEVNQSIIATASMIENTDVENVNWGTFVELYHV
ncbi:hypothetical protein [Shimia sp.]|uniref:hypothetical protein n=1 Tax=Shimia sp. TaxID=1954381 RepID=UPI003BAC5738